MVQIAQIKELLELYVSCIDIVTNKFLMKFGQKNPLSKWRYGLIERTGFLEGDNKVEYSFHGAGCTVELENGEIISFDFLENDDVTFDLFKLKIFVQSILIDQEDEVDELFKRIKLSKVNNRWSIELNDFHHN